MTFLVIRVRSDRGVTKKIRDTMAMLNLTRVNHAVLIPQTASYEGMLQKVKDYVTHYQGRGGDEASLPTPPAKRPEGMGWHQASLLHRRCAGFQRGCDCPTRREDVLR